MKSMPGVTEYKVEYEDQHVWGLDVLRRFRAGPTRDAKVLPSPKKVSKQQNPESAYAQSGEVPKGRHILTMGVTHRRRKYQNNKEAESQNGQ